MLVFMGRENKTAIEFHSCKNRTILLIDFRKWPHLSARLKVIKRRISSQGETRSASATLINESPISEGQSSEIIVCVYLWILAHYYQTIKKRCSVDRNHAISYITPLTIRIKNLLAWWRALHWEARGRLAAHGH